LGAKADVLFRISPSVYITCKRQHLPFYELFVPGHYGLARPQTADGGGGLQTWRAAGNVLNQLVGWDGGGGNNPPP
jgi:hypothetical protein